MARSRAAIHGSFAPSAASSASDTASSGEIGRGTLRGFFGPLSRGSEASRPDSAAAKARKARTAESSRAADGEEGAQVGRLQRGERRIIYRFAEMAGEEANQAARSRDIGADCVLRP